MANYVDNKKFFENLVIYRKLYFECKEAGLEKPKISNYLGHVVYEMSTRMATRPNFSSYTYKDEMISDAIENCMLYLHCFNPEKTTNPFAYFTRVIWFAFLRRIEKEKKQSYIKYKLSTNSLDIGTESDHNALTHEMGATLKRLFEPDKEVKVVEKVGVEKFVADD